VFGQTSTSAVQLSAVAAGQGGFAIVGLSAGDGMGTSVAAAGDINLDGQVDVVDLSTLIGGGTLDTVVVRGWADGDFNYDGVCDILDIGAFLATNLYDGGPYA
jgi:hypothetical protein